MTRLAFIGLGNMGLPMARNLLAAGHELAVFDLAPAAAAAARAAGLTLAPSAADAVAAAAVVITMLPEGRHVAAVYRGADGILARAAPGSLLIDCSTIDVDTARAVNQEASEAGFEFLDAPVSGGVAGAAKATLTFMVGGSEAGFARALPLLQAMGKSIVHTGPSGNGQAAKICNNLILGITMIGVGEAFVLAEQLGLDAAKLFEVSSQSSGQCWALTSYCPVPGPVPASPANRAYQPGFTAAMMAKDLRLAQDAANATGAALPLTAQARTLYALFAKLGQGGLDFSAIVKMLRGEL